MERADTGEDPSGNRVVTLTYPSWRQMVSPPNLVSVSRIVSIAPIYWCLKRSFDHLALGLLGLALLTDALDGYLARRFRWQSNWGLILDPLADKLLIGSLALFLVVFRGLPVWLAGLIITRDLIILGVGVYLLFWPVRLIMPANRTGKMTTAVTSFALLLYLLELQPYGLWCAWLSVVCIFVSGAHYTWQFMALLKQRGRILERVTPESARQSPLDLYQKSGTEA